VNILDDKQLEQKEVNFDTPLGELMHNHHGEDYI
jgi:hypothetical protein